VPASSVVLVDGYTQTLYALGVTTPLGTAMANLSPSMRTSVAAMMPVPGEV
jgi:hypothetical protein